MNSINRLKDHLRNNYSQSSIAHLKSATDVNVLLAFKEHKLLLIPEHKIELTNAYRETVYRLIPESAERGYELNYLTFLDSFSGHTREIESQVMEFLSPLTNRGLKEFLFLVITIVNGHLAKMVEHFYENLEQYDQQAMEHEQLADFQASTQNSLRGRLVDTLFAVSNLLNIFSKCQTADPDSDFKGLLTDEEPEFLFQAITISANINSYQYALDKISYGEWLVESIERNDSKPIYKFALTDFNLEKARDLGLQRILADRFKGRREKRWLRIVLENSILRAFDLAWDHYQNESSIFVSGIEKYDTGKKKLFALLDQLDAEDELLVGFNLTKSPVLSAYLSAVTLLAFALAAEQLKGKSSKGKYLFTCAKIPLTLIENFLTTIAINGAEIVDASGLFISDLPLVQHLDLFKAPFVRDRTGIVYALDNFVFDNWPESVRVNLMRGGPIANQIGKGWEQYVAYTMLNHDWEKVATGIKLKEKNKLITDIDLVAKKGDLLLIIQLKIYYGTGINQFEQWKFKNKLIHGVSQVKKAMEVIRLKKDILNHHFSKKELDEISVIKPVVMTNAHMFNGWKYDGVSIMSTGSLMQILNGATVRFTNQNHEVISEKRYAKSDKLTTQEIVGFIDEPLDWRIGSPQIEINYHHEIFSKSEMLFPTIQVNGLE